MANLTVSTDVDNFMQAANNAAARTSLGVPAATTTISAGTGLTGGGDLSANRTLTVSYGTTSGTAAEGNDSRLSDARTPTAHASTHAAAGSDPITITAAQISGSLTQNTSGTAAGLSATLAITSGGTGQTTQAAAITALTGTQTAGRYLRSDGTNAALSAIQAADVPTLNQNTSGTAAGLSSTLAITSGGTGQTTQAAAITALTGAQVSGRYLRSDGTNATLSAIQAGDVPTLNQNTTGTAGNVSGVVAIANGGTGQTTQQAALNAIAGTQTAGYHFRSDGTNVSLQPLSASDVTAGTLGIANGGTGQTTASAALAALGGIVTANVQVFTSSGTWTKPANAKQVCVECLSGGGGGGAGGKAASGTAVYGGGGGGGGGYSRVAILASDLTDATYAVTVGSGGTGAIYGGNATAGSASSFAPSSSPTSFLARAQSGAAPGGSGGVTAPTAGSGGAPNSNAGGGSSITANASAGSASTHTATGGGGGGGISAVPTGYAGAQGGTNAICNLASLGGATSGSGNGVSATASTARTGSSLIINGSGGGGGGASTFATGSGGNGADGSGYGSGGGGGGATIGSGTGGNGGNGASGVVVITTYF